jgi:hypothetical protein
LAGSAGGLVYLLRSICEVSVGIGFCEFAVSWPEALGPVRALLMCNPSLNMEVMNAPAAAS